MKIHKLKTWPEYFQAIVSGRKRFEYRINDRHFWEGDILCLQEWNPINQDYTGTEVYKTVGYTLYIKNSENEEYAVMSLLPCKKVG